MRKGSDPMSMPRTEESRNIPGALLPPSEKEILEGEADLARKGFDICQEGITERLRQNRKFCMGSPIGVQRHNVLTWACIIGEENGEVTQAALDATFQRGDRPDFSKVREEAVQTLACCMALIERIDAKDPALVDPEGSYGNQIRP